MTIKKKSDADKIVQALDRLSLATLLSSANSGPLVHTHVSPDAVAKLLTELSASVSS